MGKGFRVSAAAFKVGVTAFVCVAVFCLAVKRDDASSSRGSRVPVMHVSEKIHSFGEVNPWEMMEHTFTVFNEGESVLRIEGVSPD